MYFLGSRSGNRLLQHFKEVERNPDVGARTYATELPPDKSDAGMRCHTPDSSRHRGLREAGRVALEEGACYCLLLATLHRRQNKRAAARHYRDLVRFANPVLRECASLCMPARSNRQM